MVDPEPKKQSAIRDQSAKAAGRETFTCLKSESTNDRWTGKIECGAADERDFACESTSVKSTAECSIVTPVLFAADAP